MAGRFSAVALHRWRRGRSSSWIAVLLSLLLATGIVALVGSTLRDSRQDAWNRASDAGKNLVQAVEHDLSSEIRLIDRVLQTAADMLAKADGSVQSPRFQPELLDALIASAHYLDAVLLIDDTGAILFNSRQTAADPAPNLVDRDYFTTLRDTPAVGLYVSRPYQSRVAGGALSIGFSRRLSHPDGGFAGIVLGVIRMDNLREVFERIQLGSRSSMTLVRDDGCLLMRNPFNEQQIGRSLSNGPALAKMLESSSGQFTAVAAIDGEERFYSYRRLEGVPVVVNVALSVREIYAAWRHKAMVVGLTTLLLAGAMVVMTLALLGALKRRHKAEQTAWESEATFRLLAENSSDVVVRIDLDGVHRYVSPASSHVFGRNPCDMVGRSILDGVLPDDLPHVREAMALLRQGRRSVTVAFRIAHSDGRLVWIEATARAVANGFSGQPEAVVAVARDISEHKRLEGQLVAAARTDGLTGLANRRAFDEGLDRAWMQARRDGTPLTLLLVDVDRFKPFNDTYGHPEGDACLRKVAAAVAGAARRPTDLAARYGGEEMAVILPHTDEASAVDLAEQLRSAVQALGLRHAGSPPAGVVTVSIGVATTVPTADGQREAAALVAAADSALYAAKHTGRNRVMAAKGVPPPAVSPPPAADEEARLAALHRFEAAGVIRPGDAELDRIAREAAEAIGTPVALVTLIGRDRQTFAGRSGMDVDSLPRETSFCAHLVASSDEALVVPNAAADFRFAGNPLVAGPPGIRFYAGTPLICPRTKKRLGTVCILDHEARAPLEGTPLGRLRQFADLAAASLERRAAATEGEGAADRCEEPPPSIRAAGM